MCSIWLSCDIVRTLERFLFIDFTLHAYFTLNLPLMQNLITERTLDAKRLPNTFKKQTKYSVWQSLYKPDWWLLLNSAAFRKPFNFNLLNISIVRKLNSSVYPCISFLFGLFHFWSIVSCSFWILFVIFIIIIIILRN